MPGRCRPQLLPGDDERDPEGGPLRFVAAARVELRTGRVLARRCDCALRSTCIGIGRACPSSVDEPAAEEELAPAEELPAVEGSAAGAADGATAGTVGGA